jgi:hypothetical protein
MTASDAAGSLPPAANQTVFAYGFDKIGATRRGEAAGITQKRTYGPLINADHADGEQGRQRHDESECREQRARHFRPFPGRRPGESERSGATPPVPEAGPSAAGREGGSTGFDFRRSQRRRTSWLSRMSDVRTATSEGGSGAFGIITRSRSAGSRSAEVRKASRIRRFQRLRTTALPTFRDTDSPSRGRPASFGRP